MSTATETKRASLGELKKFANAVRDAGGGNPLDALMPAVPEDSTQCLIAKNLNFNCSVTAGNDGAWYMHLNDEEIAHKIGSKLNLKVAPAEEVDVYGYPDNFAVILPPEIGQVAEDFDKLGELASVLQLEAEGTDNPRIIWGALNRDQKKLFRDLWPYVEASTREAYDLASIVNPDGSIVV